MIAVFFPPSLVVGTINIRYKKMDQPTFEDVSDWESEILQMSNKVYELEKSEAVDWKSGLTMNANTYIEKSNAPAIKHKQFVHIIRKQDAFIIELNSSNIYFDELLIDFERIVSSFETIE